MSSPTARKRCELACRPCRHRKIKCQTSVLGAACDNCRAKSKEKDCEYIPVSEDYPPPKPRQSPPATNHYAPLTPISPTTEYGISPSGGASSSYYSVYSQYNSPQPATPHYSSSPPTSFISSHQLDYQYPQPSSPTQHYTPSSPTSSYDCPTGMTIPAGGVEMTGLQSTWDASQGRYGYMPAPSAWPTAPTALPAQVNQPEMAYYNIDQTSVYAHQQQATQQYNGSYYNSP